MQGIGKLPMHLLAWELPFGMVIAVTIEGKFKEAYQYQVNPYLSTPSHAWMYKKQHLPVQNDKSQYEVSLV